MRGDGEGREKKFCSIGPQGQSVWTILSLGLFNMIQTVHIFIILFVYFTIKEDVSYITSLLECLVSLCFRFDCLLRTIAGAPTFRLMSLITKTLGIKKLSIKLE
jgi:hypothetical protein